MRKDFPSYERSLVSRRWPSKTAYWYSTPYMETGRCKVQPTRIESSTLCMLAPALPGRSTTRQPQASGSGRPMLAVLYIVVCPLSQIMGTDTTYSVYSMICYQALDHGLHEMGLLRGRDYLRHEQKLTRLWSYSVLGFPQIHCRVVQLSMPCREGRV